MKFKWICLFALLLVFAASANSQDWYADEENEEDDINEENGDASVLSSEEKPDLICEKDRMCRCLAGIKGTKDASVVDCSHAKLKNSGPLDTAHLLIRQEKNKDFKAEEVRLDHNDIDVLRVKMIMPGQEANILSLDFGYNRIVDVEAKAFDAFPKLLKLKLTHNRLRDEEMSDDWLTKKLGNSLHQLYLDYNYITRFDDGIFDNLNNLTKLVLDGNRGLRLSRSTFGKGLKKLRTLSLDNCGFKQLDTDLFSSLENLAQLSLSGNDFSSVPLALSKVPKLSIVALSNTAMSSIPKYAFKANPSLKNIYLRRMPSLTSVNECAFCGVPSLEVVDFTGSRHLTSIDESAFGTLSKKEIAPDNMNTLLLGECGLTSISEKLLDWGPTYKLSLYGNPLLCDCNSMQWLMNNKQGVKFQKEQPTCAAPEKLKGMSLKEASSHACGTIQADSSQKMTIIVVLVGLCASVFVVGFVYARSKGGISQFLPAAHSESPQLGYSNLTAGRGAAHNDLDDGDENRLEDDFNRPEFV